MNQLPAPSPEAVGHSEKLVQLLRKEIALTGPMSFRTYMQRVLYEPGYGYYASGNLVFGESGDFVTAPVTSALFGQCLARPVADVLQMSGGDILEFGAGTGALAAALLPELARLDQLPDRYLILEPGAPLAARQQQLLGRLPEAVSGRVRWINALPGSFSGVVLANEVLDAMPVERFVTGPQAQDTLSLAVDWQQGGLVLTERRASAEVRDSVEQLQQQLGRALGNGYCSEYSPLIRPWLAALAQCVKQALVLIIDYGYPRAEYYLPERTRGTLRCYYRHHTHEDVLFLPGLQDITADIDFTAVAEAAVDAGLDLHGFTSQPQFLLGAGLLDVAARAMDRTSTEAERLALRQQVEYLATGQSGDRFQVMGLSRSLDLDVPGLAGCDRSARL